MAYQIYTTSYYDTLSGICNLMRCNVSDVIRMNPQWNEEYNSSVSDLLIKSQTTGDRLPSGLRIKLPYGNTGARETQDVTYDVHRQMRPYSVTDVQGDRGFHDVMRSRSYAASATSTWRDFHCSMYTLVDGRVQYSRTLPVYPNEFSDNNSASFSSVGILGRSVDYQIYQGSSRDVSLVLNLHEELCEDTNYIHELVAIFESACYPQYVSGIVKVPEICLIIGSHLKIRGILSSCSATWKAPIINGKLVNCDLSVSIKETTGPYSMSQVAAKGAYRG